MNEQILEIKKLNAAYIASLEYDRCPDEKETSAVANNFRTGVTKEQLKEALSDNAGRRPDEIAMEMSDKIKQLP